MISNLRIIRRNISSAIKDIISEERPNGHDALTALPPVDGCADLDQILVLLINNVQTSSVVGMLLRQEGDIDMELLPLFLECLSQLDEEMENLFFAYTSLRFLNPVFRSFEQLSRAVDSGTVDAFNCKQIGRFYVIVNDVLRVLCRFASRASHPRALSFLACVVINFINVKYLAPTPAGVVPSNEQLIDALCSGLLKNPMYEAEKRAQMVAYIRVKATDWPALYSDLLRSIDAEAESI